MRVATSNNSQNKRGVRQWRRASQLALPIVAATLGASYIYSSFSIRLPPIGDALGPRFVPFSLGILFVCFSVLLLALEVTRGGRADDDELEAPGPIPRKLLAIVIGTIAYTVGLSYLGYVGPTFLFFLLFSHLVGQRSIWLSGLIAAGMTAAFYLTFKTWLGVELPSFGDVG